MREEKREELEGKRDGNRSSSAVLPSVNILNFTVNETEAMARFQAEE